MTVRVAGHFGEWLQGRMGPDGPVALVTLACPALCAYATTRDEAPDLDPFFAALGVPPVNARIALDMPLGAGAGASTASLVALARLAGYAGPPERLAQACLSVEGASDPLMFDAPDSLLWASREGRILDHFLPPPACEIIGGYWGAPVPTDPRNSDFDDISDLAAAWKTAVAARDLVTCARVATESASRAARRDHAPDPMAALCADLGALGIVRAHTGSARGLVFAKGAAPPRAIAALTDAGLTGVLQFQTGVSP